MPVVMRCVVVMATASSWMSIAVFDRSRTASVVLVEKRSMAVNVW
jgi:hypothetical protein